ncbi:hypothetical protein [Polaromonas sp. CG_23.6]|uniref:hypothetical protein n=1 Tax=Polaromonas sp. CG_23.6 TaxID=2760709 RepID=UPI002476584E|nr:hypothetical protein [Polaromonas sp. CG_23.6]MDH6185296.1 hypothetical protein [Polaromonas sp. CG_23.6]
MPILTEDIKLLKSAVMADVPEGGGAMTGVAVIDGQSNNLFPDTSAVDRALGRVAARKLFGVAHSDDTDTLMGAHAIVTDAPDDELVHCTLMQTTGWADERRVAQDRIEKYLVKGPRLVFRLWDTHYTGSLILKLICMVEGTPPAGGDAIVLVNPTGEEQYVRILRVSTARQQVAVIESGSTVLVSALVASCEIGNPLEFDFFGPPSLRVGLDEEAYAQSYSTNIAGGAKFFGIKPLASAGAIGDFSVIAAGGIYTPVVPAATVESPIIDLYPLLNRTGIATTAQSTLTMTSGGQIGPGTLITLPTPISPGSLRLVTSSGDFTDDAGDLKQGTLTVGKVEYKLGTVTFASDAPDYGYNNVTATYLPATVAQVASHSASFLVTVANQGRAYVNAFEPPPAASSFTLAYMAQGRWYEMVDNGTGKLGGTDISYGTGMLDPTTGSMAATLGAVPDVGSLLIATWGNKAGAVAVHPDRLPLRFGARLQMPESSSFPVTMSWSRAGTTYTASVDATGLITGDATGRLGGGTATFEPDVFPDGLVSVTGTVFETRVDITVTPVTNANAYQYQADASQLPVGPGTLVGKLTITTPPNAIYPASVVDVFDRNGNVYARYHGNKEDGIANNGSEIRVGSIDYASGLITLMASADIYMWFDWDAAPVGAWVLETYKSRKLVLTQFTIADFGALTAPAYSTGTTTTTTTTYETISTEKAVTNVQTATGWTAVVYTGGVPLRMSGMAFTMGGETYSVVDGVLRRGWDTLTGVPAVASAGTLTSDGVITVTSLPANFSNAITWSNAVQDEAAKQVGGGVFRTASAPLKTGVMQLQSGARIASANESGVLLGDGFTGTVDFQRGTVKWASSPEIPADTLSYNAVFLQYLPLDKALLGIDTVRLPLDGRVPIYRTGDLVVVHNTLTTQLPNPAVKGTAYPLGRTRLASVRVKDAAGALVPSNLYVSILTPGTLALNTDADLSMYTEPFSVEHRIEDLLLCSQADISGQVKFTRALTHAFPAGTSFVSSALPFGDLFARPHTYIEQETWAGLWADELIGTAPLPAYNEGQFPITVTNRGAISERWAMIFTSSTEYRIVGESVGIIGTGITGANCSPINPATSAPYFTLPEGGWGAGWSVGNVLRFNTAACGSPFWVIRTVMQGPSSLDSDQFSLAFRGDVDRP